MNTITNAWCTFGKNASPWNAFCWEVLTDNIYFGANGFVAQADGLTFEVVEGDHYLPLKKPDEVARRLK